MIFAADGRFTAAVLCLMFSGLCDAFDGAVARTKKNRTEDEKAFGIQLDSLCDVISFGVFPAYLCYQMGVDGIIGVICVFAYVLCAVSRLAFFNVQEGKRQKAEGGKNKVYRGLPVTSISMIFPVVHLLRKLFAPNVFAVILHILLAVTAFLFVLDFSVKKPNVDKLLHK
jgi:CDP-diacylglycerol--serine O-phosphatidyltransferase